MSERSPQVVAVRNLTVMRGNHPVLSEVSFDALSNEILLILGANGAGKTTLLETLMGILSSSGTVTVNNIPVNSMSMRRRARFGIRLVHDDGDIFSTLTVRENIDLGASFRGAEKRRRPDWDWIFEVFPQLRDRGRQYAGSLSGGEKKQLSLARAFVASPLVLLVDEPSSGLGPITYREVLATLQRIASSGTAVIVAEQEASVSLGSSDRFMILDRGRIVQSGTRGDPIDPRTIEDLYLGAVDCSNS